jgi:predicted RNA-binding protein YlxR (DUF448 family)
VTRLDAPARRYPTRTCVACRTERQKRDLVRVVRAPDGGVTLDASGRAPGRGAYLCSDGSCWATALRKRSLERALDVSLPADLVAHLQAGTGVATGGVQHGA